MNTAMDLHKHRLEVQREIFSRYLQDFVRRWAPDDRLDREEFQIDLMRLFVDAMRNQTAYMTYGIESYASTASLFQERSMDPLRVIMEEPKP